MAVADDEVLVVTTELEELEELDSIEELLDTIDDDVLLGATDPSGKHVPPRAETSLKVSVNDPLTAPYLDPVADATE